MNASRIVRAAARARQSAIRLPPQRRGYADAVSDKIKLTLALPHQVGTTSTMAVLLVVTALLVFGMFRMLTNSEFSRYTNLQMCTFVLAFLHYPSSPSPQHGTYSQINCQGPSQYTGRVWRNGCTRQPCALHRAIEAWACRGN